MAQNGDLAFVQILHERGADLELKDAHGSTPLGRARNGWENCVKQIGEFGAGELFPHIRETIRYLEAAQAGDRLDAWDGVLQREEERAAAEREERERRLAELRRTTSSAETPSDSSRDESPARETVRLQPLTMPTLIEIEQIGEAADMLLDHGFERIGWFLTENSRPAIKLIAMAHTADRLYATLNVPDRGGWWCDLVSPTSDGGTVTFSNHSRSVKSGELPRFRKVRKRGSNLAELLDAARSADLGKGPAVSLSPAAFREFANRMISEEADAIEGI